jgi:hypothetical protein
MREKRKTGSAFKVILVGQNRIIPHIEPVWDHSVTAADLMCFMFENIDMLRDDDIVMRETLLARMDDINKNADTSKSTQNIQEIIRHFVSRVENSAAKNIQDQWDPLVAWQSLITAEPDDYGPIRDEEFPSGYMEQHHQYRNVTDTGTINPLRIDSHPVDDLLHERQPIKGGDTEYEEEEEEPPYHEYKETTQQDDNPTEEDNRCEENTQRRPFFNPTITVQEPPYRYPMPGISHTNVRAPSSSIVIPNYLNNTSAEEEEAVTDNQHENTPHVSRHHRHIVPKTKHIRHTRSVITPPQSVNPFPKTVRNITPPPPPSIRLSQFKDEVISDEGSDSEDSTWKQKTHEVDIKNHTNTQSQNHHHQYNRPDQPHRVKETSSSIPQTESDSSNSSSVVEERRIRAIANELSHAELCSRITFMQQMLPGVVLLPRKTPFALIELKQLRDSFVIGARTMHIRSVSEDHQSKMIMLFAVIEFALSWIGFSGAHRYIDFQMSRAHQYKPFLDELAQNNVFGLSHQRPAWQHLTWLVITNTLMFLVADFMKKYFNFTDPVAFLEKTLNSFNVLPHGMTKSTDVPTTSSSSSTPQAQYAPPPLPTNIQQQQQQSSIPVMTSWQGAGISQQVPIPQPIQTITRPKRSTYNTKP